MGFSLATSYGINGSLLDIITEYSKRGYSFVGRYQQANQKQIKKFNWIIGCSIPLNIKKIGLETFTFKIDSTPMLLSFSTNFICSTTVNGNFGISYDIEKGKFGFDTSFSLNNSN